ncbi:MAG: uroporphyrinogen decarboxylase family protein, partial [Pseudomonadota bacterium]
YMWTNKYVVESPLAKAESVSDIESYSGWPSSDWWDYSEIARQCLAYPNHAVVNKGDRLDRTAQLKPMMYLRGMEQIYIDLVENSSLVEAMIEHIKDYYLRYNERVFKAIQGKADIFMMGDDFGTQNGPMISRDMWRKYFRKGFREYVDLAHKYGLRVMHHSCGSVKYLMEEFIDAGLDILQALQPRARDMDLRELKRAYGSHIVFHGSMDIQQTLPRGTPKDVREEVKKRMDAGKAGGGFIICTAHNILPDTPTENIVALFEAYKEYGIGS